MGWGMAQTVQHLPRKYKALNSSPSPAKKIGILVVIVNILKREPFPCTKNSQICINISHFHKKPMETVKREHTLAGLPQQGLLLPSPILGLPTEEGADTVITH
jgi:hypothetical protein